MKNSFLRARSDSQCSNESAEDKGLSNKDKKKRKKEKAKHAKAKAKDDAKKKPDSCCETGCIMF